MWLDRSLWTYSNRGQCTLNPAVYLMVGHISNCQSRRVHFIHYNITTHVGLIELIYLQMIIGFFGVFWGFANIVKAFPDCNPKDKLLTCMSVLFLWCSVSILNITLISHYNKWVSQPYEVFVFICSLDYQIGNVCLRKLGERQENSSPCARH